MLVVLTGCLAVFSIVTAVTGNWVSGALVAGAVFGLVRSGRRAHLEAKQAETELVVVRVPVEQPERWWRW